MFQLQYNLFLELFIKRLLLNTTLVIRDKTEVLCQFQEIEKIQTKGVVT